MAQVLSFLIKVKLLGTPQTCVYPDVCLGIAHVSGPVDALCICPFRPTDSLGRKGQIT